ncbi:MAG: hypothetical protein JSU86_03510 [Phycisphaerales bacterium]|nr:MAG: hypothetical protein JSU86_03510 [Phycisphaerales bacterium]
MMNPTVPRVLAIVPQTVRRIVLLVLALLSYPSAANAQIEWRVSVKIFLDESGARPCLLEPDDCNYDDCCYDTDEEIRDMFEGPGSPLAILNERGITIGEIEILELHPDALPPVPAELPIGHYCREGADDDDGPCDPLADDPCWDSRVCVERPVDYYCDDAGHNLGPCDPADADPCPGGGTCVAESYHWYHVWFKAYGVHSVVRHYAKHDHRFEYDSNAINFYLFPAKAGGRCACNPWVGPDPEAVITLGHGKNRTVPMHELGHFMGLCHTQGCEDVECHIEPPGEDHMADTLPDRDCWDRDEIADHSFDVGYDQATSSQQEQVDDVWFNIMSYHWKEPPRLTSDQLDRMMDVSGTTWFPITERCTFFVDGTPDVPPILTGHINCSRDGPRPTLDGNRFPDTRLDGSSANPLSAVASALNEAGDGDIVMIRGGYYHEQLTIDQPVFLRASKGDAVIGMTRP